MEGYSLDLLSPSLVNSIHFPFVALSHLRWGCVRFEVDPMADPTCLTIQPEVVLWFQALNIPKNKSPVDTG